MTGSYDDRAGHSWVCGADLANLVNEAAVAARQNRKVVTQFDFELAKDKVMMGVERKSSSSATKRKNTAFHVLATHWYAPTPTPIRCTKSPSSRAAWRWG
jgi:predicted ATP-dependent protease